MVRGPRAGRAGRGSARGEDHKPCAAPTSAALHLLFRPGRIPRPSGNFRSGKVQTLSDLCARWTLARRDEGTSRSVLERGPHEVEGRVDGVLERFMVKDVLRKDLGWDARKD